MKMHTRHCLLNAGAGKEEEVAAFAKNDIRVMQLCNMIRIPKEYIYPKPKKI